MNVLEILLTCLRQFELKVYSIAMANSATLYTVNEYPYIFKYFFHISRQAKKRGVSVGWTEIKKSIFSALQTVLHCIAPICFFRDTACLV